MILEYNVCNDLLLIRKMLSLSQVDIADALKIDVATIKRIEKSKINPNHDIVEDIYNYAFKKAIKLNNIKEMIYKEENKDSTIIFHGSKTGIEGNISLKKSRLTNDFGQGFYCGESISQTTSFISRFSDSSIYILNFDKKGLKKAKFNVDQNWMLAVAYFRGKLEKYKNHSIIKKIVDKVKSSDYIYAPIADNRMFMIIDRFIDGLITDEQCKHCLAATDLGNQYVFINDKSISRIKIIERCYISKLERDLYLEKKEADIKDGDNKVKYAMIKYKNEGKYIGEILS